MVLANSVCFENKHVCYISSYKIFYSIPSRLLRIKGKLEITQKCTSEI